MKEQVLTEREKPSRISVNPFIRVPRYNLENGLKKLIQTTAKSADENRVLVVEVAGGSASGKTEIVAGGLKRKFSDKAIIISMDDYYFNKDKIASLRKKVPDINYDNPASLDLELIKSHIKQLKAGKTIRKPKYNFKTESRGGYETVKPAKIIILEGLFALYPGIFELGDVKIFVDIGMHGRLIRQLLRDLDRTSRKPIEILNNFANQVQPMHERYVENTKYNADFIIENEYKADVEAQKSGLHEVQKKFRADISQETIRKLGVDRLGYSMQIDYYYNPKDRNLLETGELLRIRVEGTRRILTYKGPAVVGSIFESRPKFEFEIDEVTANRFLAFYGNVIKIIKKERTMYSLAGVVFSADSVYKIEDGQEKFIGNFIELRSVDEKDGEARIRAILSKLNLNLSDGIRSSYFEM